MSIKSIVAKSGLAVALGATALVSAAPAQAQRYDGYRGYHHGRDVAGPAIIAGIAGLAIGAAIASSNHDRTYDRGEIYDQPYRGPAYGAYGYQNDGYAYSGGYDGYDRTPVCTVQRSWDRYAQRSVLVRVCR